MKSRETEEVLEALWTAEESGDVRADAVVRRCHVPLREDMIRELERTGYLEIRGDKLLLTEQGRERAAEVIRRHRLAERLMTDVLSMGVEQAEASACEFEHALVPEVTESICTLLGHPRECPHGSPIPEGRCCREARSVIRQVAVPLTRLEVGQRARVAYLRSLKQGRLPRLFSLGISPGTTLELSQVSPAYVVRLGMDEAEVALERHVAEDIFVWAEEKEIPPHGEQVRRGKGRRLRLRFGRGRPCEERR